MLIESTFENLTTTTYVDATIAQQEARVHAVRAIHSACAISMTLLSPALARAVLEDHIPLMRFFVVECSVLRRVPYCAAPLLSSAIEHGKNRMVEYLLRCRAAAGQERNGQDEMAKMLVLACKMMAQGHRRVLQRGSDGALQRRASTSGEASAGICHLLLGFGADHSVLPADDRRLMYERITGLVLWPAVRKQVTARGIAIYWMGVAAESACAEGGPGRQADLEAFVHDVLHDFPPPPCPLPLAAPVTVANHI